MPQRKARTLRRRAKAGEAWCGTSRHAPTLASAPADSGATRQRYIDSLSITVYDCQDFLGNTMPTLSKDRLHGTLDALVLKTLSWGPRHGYAIARWLEEKTGDATQVEEGSLSYALYRREIGGWSEPARR